MFKNNELKNLRKSLKLTQKEIANKIGKSQQTYAFYETGRVTPDLSTIENLAKIFNVSVNFFFDDIILPYENNTISIVGRNGKKKTYKLSPKKLKAIEALLDDDGEDVDNF